MNFMAEIVIVAYTDKLIIIFRIMSDNRLMADIKIIYSVQINKKITTLNY